MLDECVLHREIGGRAVMREQLAHVVASVSDRISVQVAPARRHRGISGSFALATLGDRSEVAYVETAALGMTMGEPKTLTTLHESFDKIRSLALPAEMSLQLITETAERTWT